MAIRGKGEVEVLNAVSLHGGLAESWPERNCAAELALESVDLVVDRRLEFVVPYGLTRRMITKGFQSKL